MIGRRGVLTVLFGLFALPVSGATVAPPILAGKDANGIPFTIQTYEAAPTKFDLQVLPIAERYRQATKWGGSIPALNTSVVCEIADDGAVKRTTCEADSWLNREQQLAMRVVRASLLSALPKFPAIDRAALKLAPRGADPLWSKLIHYAAARGDTPPFFRVVRLAVRVDETPLAVDLTAGPLVDAAQIDVESGRAMQVANYPVRALREKRQGTQTVECQVQVDRSVICHSASFDPSKNAAYFVGEAESLFRGAIVKGQLKNGRNSVGVRFQTKLRWVLPVE